MEVYKQMLYYNKPTGLKLISRAANVGYQKSSWKPSNGGEMMIYSIPTIVKFEISLNKESFKFTWEKHIAVVDAFGHAVEWFIDSKKKDLFYKADNGELYFNNDYNSLVTSASSGINDNGRIEIRPVMVERDYKRYEGVILTVNNQETAAALTFAELTEVASIISNFNFQTALSIFMQIAANENKAVLPESEYERRSQTVGPVPFSYGV